MIQATITYVKESRCTQDPPRAVLVVDHHNRATTMITHDLPPSDNAEFNVADFKQLYKKFDSTTIANLSNIYCDTAVFKDPIHNVKGIEALREYFSGFCTPELQCEFEISNQIVAQGQAFFQWQMYYRHPRLKSGKALELNGGTLIKFDSKVFYHEDFYDMGAMIYQHIPVLGWAIKNINARMLEPTS